LGDNTLNSKYLGDALDHWKGSLISLLVSKQLLQSVVVEPMITDSRPWSDDDFQTYKRLLGLKETNQICHKESTFPGGSSEEREDYFNKVPKNGDIFLDPDTGIFTGIGRDSEPKKHIKVLELRKLLGESKRVVMVYQHSGRSNFDQWLHAIGSKLTEDRTVHCFVYECKQVAMFFISLKRNRIDEIQAVLKEYLRGTAQLRVWGCGK
jgi:hypothetical protein